MREIPIVFKEKLPLEEPGSITERSGCDAQGGKFSVENKEFILAEIFLVPFCMVDKKGLVPLRARNENRPAGEPKLIQKIKDRVNQEASAMTELLRTFIFYARTLTEDFRLKEGSTPVKAMLQGMLLFFKDNMVRNILSKSLLTSMHFPHWGLQNFKERNLTFMLSTHKEG
jgi:hypothetical protein